MSARLIPLNPGSAPTILLQRPVLIVGRHPECDVRIDLPKISRRHCCLALVYDRVVIRDLGSRNGVRLNGRVVDEAQLVSGDEVAIGPLLFRLEAPTSPQVPAPPPPPAKSKTVASATPPAANLPNLPSLPSNLSDPDQDLIPFDL